MTKFFKDWAIPGPHIPDQREEDLREDETLDALCGHFKIFQLKKGHRFSTDDLLVAWYGTSWCPSACRVLDLGSGIGSVAMTAAWRLAGANFVTIEAQDRSVALAKKSIAYNGISNRFDVRHGDFRSPEILDREEKFDLILGSPPYFPAGDGVPSEHPQALACRFELRGDISHYCEVASAHLGWGAVFSCVFPIEPQSQHERVIESAKRHGLTIIRNRPIIFKEGQSPLLAVFIMMKEDHLPPAMRVEPWGEPALIIRTKSGQVHPEYSRVKMAIGFPP